MGFLGVFVVEHLGVEAFNSAKAFSGKGGEVQNELVPFGESTLWRIVKRRFEEWKGSLRWYSIDFTYGW